MRMFSIILFVFSSSVFAASAWLWWQRRNIPYNDEGRYFDGLVVYEEQGAFTDLLLALIFFLTCLLPGYWALRRRSASKENASSIEDFE